ncbi:hypothetical protein M15_10570 [Atrimonas thermophila]
MLPRNHRAINKIRITKAPKERQIQLLIPIIVFSIIILFSTIKTEALSKNEIQKELLSLWREGDRYKSLLIEASEKFVPEAELRHDLYNILRNESCFPDELKYKALKKLSEIEEPGVLGASLIQLFQNSNSLFLKKSIIQHLANTDDWIPFLISVSKGQTPPSEETLLRLEAFKALFKWQIQQAVPDFISFLNEADLPPEQNPLKSFDDRILPYLCSFLNSSSEKLRKLALETLLENPFKTFRCVALPLNDPNPEIQALSLKVLFKHYPKEALTVAKMTQERTATSIYKLAQAILIALDGEPANTNLSFNSKDLEMIEICAQTEKGINYLLNKALLEGKMERFLDLLTRCSYVFPSPVLWRTLQENNWEPLALLRFFSREKVKLIVLKKLQEGKVPPENFQIFFTRLELRDNYHILRKILKEGETKAKLYLIPLLWPLKTDVFPLVEEVLRCDPSPAVLIEIIQLLEKIEEPASSIFLTKIATYPDIEIKIKAYLALLKKL